MCVCGGGAFVPANQHLMSIRSCAKNGWLDAGETGWMDKAGNLWLMVMGRQKGRIKSVGEMFFFWQVEVNCLSEDRIKERRMMNLNKSEAIWFSDNTYNVEENEPHK